MPARSPKLIHSCDAESGYGRRRCGRGFVYVGMHGRVLTGVRTLERIKALAIPPAWHSVWICASPRGHLQATGVDRDGRKQYLYHPHWASWRSEQKFRQLAEFGTALPALRRRVRADLDQPAGTLTCTLAALVRLLDQAHLRIGSRRHLRRTGSYGASTLLGRHVAFGDDGVLTLNFRGKGRRPVRRRLRDRKLHRVLQEIDDLPGRRLFSWIDERGELCPVTSNQVNAYIATACGRPEFSAKTFRTWAGTVAALDRLLKDPDSASIKFLSEAAARRLHNTPAICRSSYIHPRLFDLAADKGAGWPAALRVRRVRGPTGLSVVERRLVALLS